MRRSPKVADTVLAGMVAVGVKWKRRILADSFGLDSGVDSGPMHWHRKCEKGNRGPGSWWVQFVGKGHLVNSVFPLQSGYIRMDQESPLQHVYHMAPGQPHCYIFLPYFSSSSMGRILLLPYERCVSSQMPCESCPGDSTIKDDLSPCKWSLIPSSDLQCCVSPGDSGTQIRGVESLESSPKIGNRCVWYFASLGLIINV
jgi:hypothetical protein